MLQNSELLEYNRETSTIYLGSAIVLKLYWRNQLQSLVFHSLCLPCLWTEYAFLQFPKPSDVYANGSVSDSHIDYHEQLREAKVRMARY